MDVASAKRLYQRADGRAGRIFVDKIKLQKLTVVGDLITILPRLLN